MKLGLYRSGSFHRALQTKTGLLPAAWMLYWLLPSPQKHKSNRLKEGGFLGVAGGKWGRSGALQQYRQPSANPSSPDSTYPPKISA